MLSTSIGFTGGVIAEPMKLFLSHLFHQRRFRHTVYSELMLITGKMESLLQYAQTQNDPESLAWALHTFDLSPISLDAFEHYYTSERTLIYSVADAAWLVHAFKHIRSLNRVPDDPPANKIVEIRKTLEHIYSLADRGSLEWKPLCKTARQWTATRQQLAVSH